MSRHTNHYDPASFGILDIGEFVPELEVFVTLTSLFADWHLEAGLAIVFAEAPQQNVVGATAQIIKQEWLDLCPIYDALPAALQ